MHLLTNLLVYIGLAAGYWLFVLIRPMIRCPRCKGIGVKARKPGKRPQPCWMCHNHTGYVRLPFSKQIHRQFHAMADERLARWKASLLDRARQRDPHRDDPPPARPHQLQEYE